MVPLVILFNLREIFGKQKDNSVAKCLYHFQLKCNNIEKKMVIQSFIFIKYH